MAQTLTKQQVLEQVKAAYGFVPNLMASMVEQNAAVGAAYMAAGGALESGVLTAAERQAVMLAVSAFNDRHYCTAAHRTVAASMGVAQADLDAIDSQKAPENRRLRTLVEATWTVMRERGFLNAAAREKCQVTTPELYEIIGIIGFKTISNYIHHVQHTEIDEALLTQATRAPRSEKPK